MSAIDALLIINLLNGSANDNGSYPDVNADAYVTAIDALLVINQLNASRPAGEGEADTLGRAPASADAFAIDRVIADSELWKLLGFEFTSIDKRKRLS